MTLENKELSLKQNIAWSVSIQAHLLHCKDGKRNIEALFCGPGTHENGSHPELKAQGPSLAEQPTRTGTHLWIPLR